MNTNMNDGNDLISLTTFPPNLSVLSVLCVERVFGELAAQSHMRNWSVDAMAIAHYRKQKVLLAGVGYGADFSFDTGIMRSPDGGLTWYLSVIREIFSSDAGATWETVSETEHNGTLDIAPQRSCSGVWHLRRSKDGSHLQAIAKNYAA